MRFAVIAVVAILAGMTFLSYILRSAFAEKIEKRPAVIGKDRFSFGPDMSVARTYVGSYPLADGNALVMSAFDKEHPAEIFDYRRGVCCDVDSIDTQMRFDAEGHASVCGQRLSPELDQQRLLHARLQGVQLPEGGYGQPVLLPGSRVFFAGGINRGGGCKPKVFETTDKAALYDLRQKKIVWTGHLHESRCNGTSTLLDDGRVLLDGGQQFGTKHGKFYSVNLDSTEIFDPASCKVKSGPNLSTWRYDHEAIKLRDGRVLLLCGVCPSSVSNPKRSDVYDPKTNRITATGPQVFGYKGSATVLLPSGNVFTCGSISGDYGAQIFVARENKFVDAGPMKEPRAMQTACVLGDGSVLIAGGQHVWGMSADTPPLKTTEIFRE